MNLAYVAGIVDGEGCIQFSRCRGTVFPRVLVTNTNLSMLEALRDQFGGDIKPLCLRRSGWKQGYSWRLSWSKAVEFLNRISPWLMIKADQASTVFAWDAVRPGAGKGRGWDVDSLDLLVRRMKWLNAKGPTQGDDPINEAIALDKARRPIMKSRSTMRGKK